MRSLFVLSAAVLTLACSPWIAGASSFEDESTPIEQEGVKTIDQLNSDTNFEDESTPIEQGDVKTIDQINDSASMEDESTPVEKDDIKMIDQLN